MRRSPMGETGRMESDSRIFVAGGDTLVGAALLRELKRRGCRHVFGGPGQEPDLTDAGEVDAFFADIAPKYVFLAAGKSGGILANRRYPADLIRDNLLVECCVIHSAHRHDAEKLLYLASSCAYPKDAPQPMHPDSLLSGPLEPTNEAYAVAKIAGIKLCQAYRNQYGANFICGAPANVFGPGDDFSPENSHVIAALIRRMHEAKIAGADRVEIWGTGSPRREFVFAEDVADACIFVMNEYDKAAPINLGCGADLSIRELAEAIREVVGFDGRLAFDPTKPDGMPLKALDSSELRGLGWRPKTSFPDALQAAYTWFVQREQGGCDAELVTAGSSDASRSW